MSSEPERTPEESEHDLELAALLRAVARPAPAAQQVAAHLRLTAEMGLDSAALQEAVGLAGEREPRAGDVLDQRYEIERVLGRGGMGVVYEARNLQTGKRVALKWMAVQAGLAPDRVLAMSRRFRREARAAASVRHPNVVDIYDIGGSDTAPFLVMELLEGEPLRAWMTRSRASWDEALRVLLPVLPGVEAMHRAGVIHRDLKPDNIFLCRRAEGEGLLPKVLDFGVAAMQDSADGLGSLTRSGALLGTPSYMALEQLTGKDVDARTDLYALGVVLYEMLTGELPFAVARGAGELAVLQATTRPCAPGLRCPELRGAREQVLLKALARDPHDRFQSAAEFAQALVAARRPKQGRGGVGRLATGFLLVGLLFALAGLAWWHTTGGAVRERPPSMDSARPQPAARGSGSSAAAPGRSELLHDVSPPAHVPPAAAETVNAPAPPPVPPAESASRTRGKRRGARAGGLVERQPTDLNVEDF